MIRKAPIYSRIYEELFQKIDRGTWTIGHQLPTEEDLTAHYNVSRGTVRRALQELELAGLITRSAGQGTFVSRLTEKPATSYTESRSLTEQLTRAGFDVQTEILDSGLVRAAAAPGRAATAFGRGDDAELIHIRRLRRGNGMPFAVQSVFLLPDTCPGILDEDLSRLYPLYQNRYKRQIGTIDERLRVLPVRALPDGRTIARLLEIKYGDPVVVRDKISFDQHNEPFEVLYAVDRSDRFVYHYIIDRDLTAVAEETGEG